MKQQEYIKGLTEGKTKKEAALAAGYSLNTALTASENIESNKLKQELHKSLQKLGLTDELIVGKLKEGLEAVLPEPPSWRDDDFPDYNVRVRYLALLIKLRLFL